MHVSSPISSHISPPYSPISSHCNSSSQEFGEMVQDQPVLLSHATPVVWLSNDMGTKSLMTTWKRTENHKTKHWRGKHTLCTTSIHDRLKLSTYSDDPPDIDLRTLGTNTILPSQQELDDLIHKMVIIAGQIVHKYIIPGFTEIPHLSKQHIKHSYFKQMSSKSTVVSVMLLCAHYHIARKFRGSNFANYGSFVKLLQEIFWLCILAQRQEWQGPILVLQGWNVSCQIHKWNTLRGGTIVCDICCQYWRYCISPAWRSGGEHLMSENECWDGLGGEAIFSNSHS